MPAQSQTWQQLEQDPYYYGGNAYTIANVLATIRTQESGGNYTAQNPHATASGAYQFIDSTWQGLLKEFGLKGPGHAADASKSLQDEVATRYVYQILESHGGNIATVPEIWYVGSTAYSSGYVPAGNSISVGDYQTNWLKTLTGGKYSPSTTKPPGVPPPGNNSASQTAANNGAKSIQHVAGAYGVNLSFDTAMEIYKSKMPSSELNSRLQAIQMATQHDTFFKDIESQVKAAGGKTFSFSDRVSALLGTGDPGSTAQFFKAYENAVNTYAAQTSGIGVFDKSKNATGDLSLTQKQIDSVSASEPGAQTNLADQQKIFKSYAAWALQYYPESRLRGIGITHDQLLAAVQGKSTAMTDDQMTRLQDEVKASYQILAGGAATKISPRRGDQIFAAPSTSGPAPAAPVVQAQVQ